MALDQVTVVVLDDAGLLLLVRAAAGLTVPGITRRPEETGAQAATRAVREQTGVDVSITGVIAVYRDLSVCYRGRPHSGELTGAAVWVEPEGLDLGALDPPVADRIRHGTRHHAEPFYA